MQTNISINSGSPVDVFTGVIAYLAETVGGYKDGVGLAQGIMTDVRHNSVSRDLRDLLLKAEGAHNLIACMPEPEDVQTPPAESDSDPISALTEALKEAGFKLTVDGVTNPPPSTVEDGGQFFILTPFGLFPVELA